MDPTSLATATSPATTTSTTATTTTIPISIKVSRMRIRLSLVPIPHLGCECLFSSDLNDSKFAFDSIELLCATETTAEGEDALVWVVVGGWVPHSERTVHSTAILELNLAAIGAVLCVARVTEVEVTSAVEQSHGATVTALEVDVSLSVFLAIVRTCPKVLKEARLAPEVFLHNILPLLFLSHLKLAVDKSTKERFAALATLVERALIEGELEGFFKVVITGGRQTFILKDALVLGNFKRFSLDFRLELGEFGQICLQDLTVNLSEGCLATWAAHESKRDLQGRPLMLEKIADAL